jgi:hypothetical protein
MDKIKDGAYEEKRRGRYAKFPGRQELSSTTASDSHSVSCYGVSCSLSSQGCM